MSGLPSPSKSESASSRRAKPKTASRAFRLLLTLFLATIAFAQSRVSQTPSTSPPNGAVQGLTSDQNAKLQQLAKLQKNFGKKMNSPDVELSLKETNRSRATDRTLVTYRLFGTGFPQKDIFTLVQVQIDGTVAKVMEGVTLDASGQAICAGREGTCQGDGPNDPIDLIVFAAKGEPKRFGLISDDAAHLKGFVYVVPFPNATDEKGCRLESIIGTVNGELTYIQGSGFEPNTELTIDIQSYDEKHHDISKADADGSYFTAMLPYVAGKKSGTTVWQAKAKNCNPKLTFTWGTYHLE